MIRTLVALLVATALLTSAPAATAEDGTYPFELVGFGDIALDEARGHLFITQTTGELLVLDLEGRLVRSLAVHDGANQMAIDLANNVLWVAGNQLTRVDLRTLVAQPVPHTSQWCPGGVAVAAGLVWFTTTCDHMESGPTAAYSPQTGEVTVFADVLTGMTLASSPARPGTLLYVSSAPHGHQAHFYSYAVTGGPRPTVTLRGQAHAIGASPQVAFTPDGAAFVSEHGEIFRSSDAKLLGDLEVPDLETSVAVRADGLVAIGGNGIRFYNDSGRAPVRWYPPPAVIDYTQNIVPMGIVFGARALYAITTIPELRVLTLKERAGVDIATDMRHYRQGQQAVVTATLQRGVTNRSLDIYAERGKSGDRVLIASGRVNARGALTTRYPVTEFTRFYAVYTGDEQTDAGSATVDAFVKTTVYLDVHGARRKVDGVHLFPVRGRAVFQATVRPWGPTNCVIFYLGARVRGEWYDAGNTKCLPVNNQGIVKASLKGQPELAGYLLSVSAYWYANDGTSKQTSSGAGRLKFVR